MIDTIVDLLWWTMLFGFVAAFATACAAGIAAMVAAITTAVRMIRNTKRKRRQ